MAHRRPYPVLKTLSVDKASIPLEWVIFSGWWINCYQHPSDSSIVREVSDVVEARSILM